MDLEQQLEEELLNQQIDEEYENWRQNSNMLYDILLVEQLESPCLTVQWLPIRDNPIDKDYSIQKVVLGSNKEEENWIQIMKVRLFKQEPKGTFQSMEVETKIMHDGEINKLRYCPQKFNIIATQSNNGDIYLFDYTKHPSMPKDKKMKQQLILKGQREEGYGLSWSLVKEGLLASSSNDHSIRLWDIEQAKHQDNCIECIQVLEGHNGPVNDISFVKNRDNVLVSVSDDKCIKIWDNRKKQAVSNVIGHKSEIYSIDTSYLSEHLMISGSQEGTIKLWDQRNLSTHVHSFESHKDTIIRLEFVRNSTMFGSSSKDRRVNIWDIARIGMDMNKDDIEDGVPELVFSHGGHRSSVEDFHFDFNDEFMVASVELSNPYLQCWKFADIFLEYD